MLDAENISKGLGREIDADELAFIESETEEVLASGLNVAFQECGDMGAAIDCMIMSARAYLERAEQLREIYLKGLH